MRTPLDSWLAGVTYGLSAESAAQVRAEIAEHYDSAIASGATEREALAALGNWEDASDKYRRVLLTHEEAEMLRSGHWELRGIHAHPNWRWTLVCLCAVFLGVGAALAIVGQREFGDYCFAFVTVTGVMTVPLFVPIDTPKRSRLYRSAKWVMFLAIPWALRGYGQFVTILGWFAWPMYVEYVNAKMRRKLPVERWPKMLYL